MWRKLLSRTLLPGPNSSVLRGVRYCSGSKNVIAEPSPVDKEEKQLTFSSVVKPSTANTFGNLSAFHPHLEYDSSAIPVDACQDLDDHDGEIEYYQKLSDPNRPLPIECFNEMYELLQPPRMDLKAALDLFDVEMKKDLVQPIPQMYRLLIHACGLKGYFEKAFELYGDYNSRNFPHNYGLYCDLFNSCANVPADDELLKTEALRRTYHLKEKLLTQVSSAKIPFPVYNTMIKALGRCGDVEAAFGVVDEMMHTFKFIESSTVAHVLQACVSDKEAGFRHALILWRKVRQVGCKLNVYSYNLMLRIVKECKAGDLDHLQDVLIESMSSEDVRKMKRLKVGGGGGGSVDKEEAVPWYKMEIRLEKSKARVADDGQVISILNSEGKQKLQERRSTSGGEDVGRSLPNLLEKKPNFSNGQIVGFSGQALDEAPNRFHLLGNVDGFLRCMVEVDGVRPDVKTFSQMLVCVPTSCLESENAIVEAMKKHKVRPNVGFFNQLMARRIARRDYKEAKALLEDIGAHGLSPDLTTFKNLAICCGSNKETASFFKDLKAMGLRPNVQIMTALVNNAMLRYDPGMVQHLLETMTNREKIRPDVRLLKKVENFFQNYRHIIVNLEKGNATQLSGKVAKFHLDRMKASVEENRLEHWREFVSFYKRWLRSIDLDVPAHPWKQYLTSKDVKRAEVRTSKVFKHVVGFNTAT